VFNTTFKNIAVTTFVAEIGIPREIHRSVVGHWQTLSHNVLSSTPSSNWNIFESGVKHLTSNGQMMDHTFVYVVNNIKHLWVSIFLVSRGVKFLEKWRENVQIFQALRWRFDIWEAIFAVKNDGMSARNSYIQM
jgi:hypothetical protein